MEILRNTSPYSLVKMKSLIILACVAFAASLDDGQWHPWADNSYAGNFRWATPMMTPFMHRFKRDLITPSGVVLPDDGQWKPALDGSWLGSGNLMWGKGVVAPHAAIIAHRFKRDLLATPYALSPYMINAHALSLPMDAPHVAMTKNAHLIQQATEGARNMLGGGIPLALPADTPEVAAGKVAHAIAHSHQKAVTAGLYGSYIM